LTIVGLIRIGCWAALLVYWYLLVSIAQWHLSWLGLVPSASRLQAKGISTPLDPLLVYFFEHVVIGPAGLLMSPCVSLRKNRKGFGTFLKWMMVWAMSHYLSSVFDVVAVLSDVLFLGLTAYGFVRTLRHSFTTALAIAPTVAVVLVDLRRLQVSD
jgi:hypothetical protein